jgi:hypothetical protein
MQPTASLRRSAVETLPAAACRPAFIAGNRARSPKMFPSSRALWLQSPTTMIQNRKRRVRPEDAAAEAGPNPRTCVCGHVPRSVAAAASHRPSESRRLAHATGAHAAQDAVTIEPAAIAFRPPRLAGTRAEDAVTIEPAAIAFRPPRLAGTLRGAQQTRRPGG